VNEIREGMDIIGACGTRLGTVGQFVGGAVGVRTDNPLWAVGHHWLPVAWVASVDQGVRLNRSLKEVWRAWQSEPAAAWA
jgi:hypothetical protein